MTDVLLRTKYGQADVKGHAANGGCHNGISADSFTASASLLRRKLNAAGDEQASGKAALQYLSEVASLEHLFSRTVETVNKKVLKSVSVLNARDLRFTGVENELRMCWDWLSQAQQCAQVHLRTAADYHQVSLPFSLLFPTVQISQSLATKAHFTDHLICHY